MTDKEFKVLIKEMKTQTRLLEKIEKNIRLKKVAMKNLAVSETVSEVFELA